MVEWGVTESMGNTSIGTASVSEGDSKIHTVLLDSLERFTRYFYQVRTGEAFSEIQSFKTPPFSSDNESFRIIAMSDMQRDGSHPDKFREIVEDGIMDYLDDEVGGDITDNLALVMIPGDLVVNGNNYASWEQTFFQPSENLLSRIPVYPVPGNHETTPFTIFNISNCPITEQQDLQSTGGTRTIAM